MKYQILQNLSKDSKHFVICRTFLKGDLTFIRYHFAVARTVHHKKRLAVTQTRPQRSVQDDRLSFCNWIIINLKRAGPVHEYPLSSIVRGKSVRSQNVRGHIYQDFFLLCYAKTCLPPRMNKCANICILGKNRENQHNELLCLKIKLLKFFTKILQITKLW